MSDIQRIPFTLASEPTWIDVETDPAQELPMKADIFNGIWIRQIELHARQTAQSHKHAFDHATLLVEGKLLVIVEGQGKIYDAPDIIPIGAGLRHQIVGIANRNLFYCIHRLEEGEDEPRSEP